ncbi:MAG: aminoglycoside phosphotransferase family protein [Phycisphaerales bacterium]|nr:MAG: aminoglycoside phosphotransferase family protein [Phycisphaerales bacterium]
MVESGVRQIIRQFRIEGRPARIEPLTCGHINDTYVVVAETDGGIVRYILQRINDAVFRDPVSLMENVVRVTEHIRSRMESIDAERAGRQPAVIAARDGAGCYRDGEGGFWRVYTYIEGAVTYDKVESEELAHEAARTFGWFQNMLTDLPGPGLHETIADFHNTPKRLETFERVARADPCNRARNAKAEIEFVLENATLCDVLLNAAQAGEIPVRVIHNDAKINNVMLDENTHKGVCVIDLDTVMPGLSVYDFGDMVRTVVTLADEDERDLSKVAVNMQVFEAIVEGYAGQTKGFLCSGEKEHLVVAGKLITFEQLIRFLGDYLAGDVYYKIGREGHNLDRSRAQMKLVRSIMENEEAMNATVERAFRQIE